MTASKMTQEEVNEFREDVRRLRTLLGRAVVGQDRLIAELTTALFAGGHVLLEGLPGLGKTHLAKGLARALGLSLARIQCTPDLMPADITGSEMLLSGEEGHLQALQFRRGPIFAPLVLVDEINRAAPKTQAALLEAMQEGQVTHGGTTYALPRPFWVVATQNPIELEGTYPLPEAQMDRFLFKLAVPTPSRDALVSMIDVSLDDEPSDHLPSILTATRVFEMIHFARGVVVAEELKRAAVDLILLTHTDGATRGTGAREHIRYGASPRGLQGLLRSARVTALCDGRAHVSLSDLEQVALPALRHRILLRIQSEMDGVAPERVLLEILAQWKKTR